jgi:phosphotransferase system enzyme I (PtsI)
MQIKKGIPASPGICISKVFLLETEPYFVTKHLVKEEDILSEIARFKKAVEESMRDIQSLSQRLAPALKEKTTSIIDAHITMLKDEHINTEIIKEIKDNRFTAERAVTTVLKKYTKVFLSMDNEFFSNRVQDIYDIESRLFKKLLKKRSDELGELKEEVVLVANDLTPTQTIALDHHKIKGFATNAGGSASHTAIIARSLGIPAVVGLKSITFDVSTGDTIIIDGNSGVVIVDPDEETIRKYAANERSFISFEKQLIKETKKQSAVTKDGYSVSLFANIDIPSEVDLALKYGVNGVGLLRTEFLYPSADHLPTEKEHFEVYKKMASKMGSKEVVIRTLDVGADKLPLEDVSQERNPFLGFRAIRFSFQQIEMFKAQLRAILRASEFGNISVMFPMISSYEEVIKAKSILQEVKDELERKNIPFKKDIRIGIMIEVPAAAIIADMLCNEVDFFSIGTNDLIQYTLAVDRGNEKVASLFQPGHPAVFRLIKNVIDVGHRGNKTVSMCGEMAGDIVYTLFLLGLGLKVFSMTPVMIPEIKKIIRSVKFSEAKKIADTALLYNDAGKLTKYLQEYAKQILPQLF